MNLMLPFTSKILPDGKKLFRRKHGYVFSQAAGTSSHEIVVPYPAVKINEAEFVGCVAGCTADLKVLDTAEGTYSTIPNYQLNQFGFNVNIREGEYNDKSEYDADLYQGMRIVIDVTSPEAFDFRINIVFHEVVG